MFGFEAAYYKVHEKVNYYSSIVLCLLILAPLDVKPVPHGQTLPTALTSGDELPQVFT